MDDFDEAMGVDRRTVLARGVAVLAIGLPGISGVTPAAISGPVASLAIDCESESVPKKSLQYVFASDHRACLPGYSALPG